MAIYQSDRAQSQSRSQSYNRYARREYPGADTYRKRESLPTNESRDLNSGKRQALSNSKKPGYANRFHFTYFMPSDAEVYYRFKPDIGYVRYNKEDISKNGIPKYNPHFIDTQGNNKRNERFLMFDYYSSYAQVNSSSKFVRDHVEKCLNSIGIAGSNGNIGAGNNGVGNIGNDNIGHCNVGSNNAGSGNVGKGNVGNFNYGNENVGNFNIGDKIVGDKESSFLLFGQKRANKYKYSIESVIQRISTEWASKDVGYIGEYISKNVQDALNNTFITYVGNKIIDVKIPNTLDRGKSKKGASLTDSEENVVASILYHTASNKVKNMYLNEDQFITNPENSNQEEGRTENVNQDTFGILNSLLNNPKYVNLLSSGFQVIGINGVVKDDGLQTNVIDGGIPNELKADPSENDTTYQKRSVQSRTSARREIDKRAEEVPGNTETDSPFPKVLYYYRGKESPHPDNDKIGITVDVVFVDKVLTIPREFTEIMNELLLISEKNKLIQKYDALPTVVSKISYFPSLMGIIEKDVKVSVLDTTEQTVPMKRREYREDISADSERLDSSAGNASRQHKITDDAPSGADKKSFDRRTNSTYKYKFGYAGEKRSGKVGQNNGPASNGQESNTDAEDRMAELDASINMPMINTTSVFKRQQVEEECTISAMFLETFVHKQFSWNLNYTLDFPGDNIDTKKEITTISSVFRKRIINLGDIIGKVITKSGIIYVLSDPLQNKLCITEYKQCLPGKNQKTEVQGCTGNDIQSSLNSLENQESINDNIKQEVSDLGTNPGCVNLPLLSNNQNVSPENSPDSDLTCLFEKYNILQETDTQAESKINQRFSTMDMGGNKKKRRDMLIGGPSSIGDSDEVSQPNAKKREAKAQNTSAQNWKNGKGGVNSNAHQIHENMNF
ncbi:putative PPE family protein PPE42 [Smittium culicis]|uniref:Putative PPE family protein PPE42 n=1 Tax=Smittium culicis TaxID=133412 RepID=A0A1R1XG28_9FUNG|nr:putative PPE family protein PPE42 [Smittium culicis]